MLVAEDYLIIYMNGATPRSKMPGISWLKKCYQMIDRRWEKEKLWRKYSNILIDMLCNWMDFVLFRQIEEEPEVFGHRSSHLVHTHCPGYIQALYQVIHTNQQNESLPHQWWIDCNCGCVVVVLLSSAVWSSWIRSSMSTAWMNWQRSSPWSTSMFPSVWCSKYLRPRGGDNELKLWPPTCRQPLLLLFFFKKRFV